MPLLGYIDDPATTPEEQDFLGPRDPASSRAVRQVLMTGGTTGSLTDLVLNEGRRDVEAAGRALGFSRAAPTLSADEANRRFGIDGELTFAKPVSETEAAWRNEAKRDELFRRDILTRNRAVGPLGAFGWSMLGGAVDPINLGLTVLPIIGEGRWLGLAGTSATRAGAFGRGLVRGGLEGAGGAGLAEGLTYGLAHGREGRDYSAGDAALGITMGAVFGAGAGGLLDAVGWRAPLAQTAAADFAGRIERLGERSRQDQISPKGAIGVMQMLPDTAKAAARRLKVPFDEAKLRTDPAYNRMLGAEEARHLLDRYDGDEMLAAAAYNAGPGRVDKWIKEFGDPRAGEISHADFARRIPFEETRAYVGRVARGAYGGTAPETAAGGFDPLPAPVSMLDESARAGALVKAVDDLAADRPVEVASLIDQQLDNPSPHPALDEAADAPVGMNARLLDGDTVATARGSEVPVRYALVELDSLKTSHDDHMVARPDYPDALRPQAPDRRASLERQAEIEKSFEPEQLLGREKDADRGVPVVSRDGTVESGNGRTILLRRSSAEGTGPYARYVAALRAAGYDLSGFTRPVLVRLRETPLDGGTRVRLAREMSVNLTEGDRARLSRAAETRGRKGARRVDLAARAEANSPATLQRIARVEAAPRTAKLRGAAEKLQAYAAEKRVPRAGLLGEVLNDASLRSGFDIGAEVEAFLTRFFRDESLTKLKPRADLVDELRRVEAQSASRQIVDGVAERLADEAPSPEPPHAGLAAREPGTPPARTSGRPADGEAGPEAGDPELRELQADIDELAKALGDEAPAETAPADAIAEAVKAAVFCLREG